MKKNKILITGGAGFIGSEFVRQAIKEGYQVTVVDKLTYAGDLKRLKEVKGKINFYKTDICNRRAILNIFKESKPEIVAHFAAETHVDRSILDGIPFARTNFLGTQNLLDVARKHKIERFIHISSDEVYGEIMKGKFYENTPLKPNSPYSVSKAAADLLVKSYIRTFNFPGIIIRPSNNYGPWQYPEKFIPVVIYKALKNEKVPVYAKGLNVREWLYVSDCACAILSVLQYGKIGEIYNVGSGNEKKNIEIVHTILGVLKRSKSLIAFIHDRAGHDFRYALSYSKLKNEIKWKPRIDFITGIKNTINWYKQNLNWLERKTKYLHRS